MQIESWIENLDTTAIITMTALLIGLLFVGILISFVKTKWLKDILKSEKQKKNEPEDKDKT